MPITEYCDTNKLDTRQRLALFVQVCQAVQHAHQKGVIHRDIKPTQRAGHAARRHAGAEGDRLRHRQGDAGAADRPDAVHRVPPAHRHAGVHEPRAGGDERASTSTRGATSTRSACCCTSCSPARRRSTRRTCKQATYAEMQRMIREVEPPKPSTRLSGLGDTLTTVAATARDRVRAGWSSRSAGSWTGS